MANGGHVLRNRIQLRASVDLDNVINPGVYALEAPTNGPAASDYLVEVLVSLDAPTRSVVQTSIDLADGSSSRRVYDGASWGAWGAISGGGGPESIIIAVGDETTVITTGTAKVTFRMPYAFTLTGVRASLTTASSSGTPTVDINEGGSTILSTKLTIDANEKTSTTAASAAVISDASLADDAEMTIDIDVAGTNATGLKVTLLGTPA